MIYQPRTAADRFEGSPTKDHRMAETTRTIDDVRIARLNEQDVVAGRYVLYWMQQSQRAECNHALEFAVQQANERNLPVLVAFGLMDGYPEANERHYRFMLQGLEETQRALYRRGIRMVVQHGHPQDVALTLADDAAMVVCDRGYLRHQKAWRHHVADHVPCAAYEVEADVVVPIDLASDRREYAARTIRPKIHKHLERFLVDLRTTPVKRDSLGLRIESMDLADLDAAIDALDIDRTVQAVAMFQGGTTQARTILQRFIDDRFANYSVNRNRPETDDVSHMSKYLHFGQISPVYVAMRILEAAGPNDENRQSYIEELIVRRELAMNFVNFTPDYDRYTCLPQWAQKTLEQHRDDERPHHYTRQQLEDAQTHDPYWNAAMREMRYTGYMHNYMRMYWGKKILEWTNTPQYAHQVALELNNKYFIDGRDGNSYTGVNWVFGLHDRPWGERPIFGTVRYMAASGLERKADPKAYVRKVDELVAKAAD